MGGLLGQGEGGRLPTLCRMSSMDVNSSQLGLIYVTRGQEKNRSQPFRTLFLQETIKRGLLMPSLVVSFSHTDDDIARTIEAIGEALYGYRKAVDEGIEQYLIGRSIKPVSRSFNGAHRHDRHRSACRRPRQEISRWRQAARL
jgi:glutamate-1-semialdehyde 2,1-aminomutase